MAQLSEADRLFLAQRRERRRRGLFVVPGMLAVLILVWVALFFVWPMAVNPKAIMGAQERGELTCGSGNMTTWVISAAVLVNVALTLLGAMLVTRIAWARTEGRYLKLLDKTAVPETALATAPLPHPGDRPLRQ